MNRERKYRAWLPSHQKMVYSSAGDDDSIFLVLPCGIIVQTLEIIDKCPGGMYHEQTEEWETASDAVIMDFIGLKDKNGKDIYEGDILTDYMNEIVGVVEWQYSEFIIRPERLHWKHIGKSEDWKVIGNIYEHPDLLK